MTSLSFVFGVFPLAIATGAGAGSRRAAGVAVFDGMIAATVMSVLLAPMFFVVVQKLAGKKHGQRASEIVGKETATAK